MNYELFGISLYVGVMLIVGFYLSRRIKTDDDYFLAGRSLGPGLATFSIFATWFGAESCIGTSGAVYRSGLGTIHADPFGYSLCIFIMGLFFAKVLWKKKITTLPDLFRERFSISTERFAALIMIPSSLIWAGAQIRAFGQIIHVTSDFSVTTAVTVAAFVIILYTMCGGMLADAYSDLIQGFTVIGGLLFLLVAMVMDLGGIGEALASIPKSKLSFEGETGSLSLLGKLEVWMVPILGSLMAQELVSRVISSRSPEVARRSCLQAGSLYLIVGCIPVLVGLMGFHYFPNLENSETLMPLLAKTHLNTFFYIIFVGALVAAILSTVDTTLLSASALLTHNLINPSFKNLSDRTRVLLARLGVLASGATAYGIAFLSDSITGLVETASSLGGPSILVMTLIALYVKKGSSFHAITAMVVSVLTWGLGHFVFEVEYPVLLTVLFCGVGYFMFIPFSKATLENEMIESELS